MKLRKYCVQWSILPAQRSREHPSTVCTRVLSWSCSLYRLGYCTSNKRGTNHLAMSRLCDQRENTSRDSAIASCQPMCTYECFCQLVIGWVWILCHCRFFLNPISHFFPIEKKSTLNIRLLIQISGYLPSSLAKMRRGIYFTLLYRPMSYLTFTFVKIASQNLNIYFLYRQYSPFWHSVLQQ